MVNDAHDCGRKFKRRLSRRHGIVVNQREPQPLLSVQSPHVIVTQRIVGGIATGTWNRGDAADILASGGRRDSKCLSSCVSECGSAIGRTE